MKFKCIGDCGDGCILDAIEENVCTPNMCPFDGQVVKWEEMEENYEY